MTSWKSDLQFVCSGAICFLIGLIAASYLSSDHNNLTNAISRHSVMGGDREAAGPRVAQADRRLADYGANASKLDSSLLSRPEYYQRMRTESPAYQPLHRSDAADVKKDPLVQQVSFEEKFDEFGVDDSESFQDITEKVGTFLSNDGATPVPRVEPEATANSKVRDEPDTVEDFYETQSIDSFINQLCSSQLMDSKHLIRWSLDDALNAALYHSYRAASLRLEKIENLQDIGISVGQFDVVSFFEANYDDSNSPVQNSFEAAGGIGRIRGEEFSFRYGFRKELQSGGQIEIGESLLTRSDDSGVLVPNDQARSGLTLSFSKELLRGSGRAAATNEVLVAMFNANAENAIADAALADLVQEVAEAYWDIFAARGQVLAAQESVRESEAVLRDLWSRKDIDADPNLIEQARVTVGQQKLIVTNAKNSVLQAQFELIRLINAPELLANRGNIEFLPVAVTNEFFGEPDVATRQTTAIHNRFEIKRVLHEIRRSQQEHHFSINQLLPQLQFTTEASFDGLAANRDISAAATNRFDSDASYQIGFNFERPISNRQARFRKRQVEWELAKLENQWKDVVEQVKSEVHQASQDLLNSQYAMVRQQEIHESLSSRLKYLELRKNELPREGDIPSFQLSQLLDVLTSVASVKSDYASTLADRGRAIIGINRATGILVSPTPASLDHPGNQFRIYHQLIEGERAYRGLAKAVVEEVRTTSQYQCDCGKLLYCQGDKTYYCECGRTHRIADEQSRGCDSKVSFGYPELVPTERTLANPSPAPVSHDRQFSPLIQLPAVEHPGRTELRRERYTYAPAAESPLSSPR